MKAIFENPFEYKLIYILKINDKTHEGCLKIGDASIKTTDINQLKPSCSLLNKAAKKRIDEYTRTAGIEYDLLYTELAVKFDGLKTKAFRDNSVHDVLKNSNIQNVKIGNTTGREWFKTDLDTAIKAIKAVKENKRNLSDSHSEVHSQIILRPEQETAIKKTKEYFKKHNTMLWNAKMRFGKTLSALKLIKELQFKKSIIITHRPVVDKGWYEDFGKIFNDTKDYIYGSKGSGYKTIENLEKQNKNFVYFASIQDLRGSSLVGGNFDKNEDIYETDWDFVIIDEAHEGTKTDLGQDVKELLIKNNHTKVLELSGTPFNILEDFNDPESIYTWDYLMEQKEKSEWDTKHFGDSNPYEELPQLKMFTYDLGDLLSTKSYVDIEDKAFNFKEFFRTKTEATMPEFVHEKDVLSFLNLMTKEDSDSLYPFSTEEYRQLFKHSFWLIPGVKEAQALSKMLQEHPIFHSFKIVNIAGDGDPDDMTGEALKSVKKAIEENEYTITLSCGKLTTGTTIPQWTAVFMLSGTYTVSAARYLQTIFRVQNPCNIDGKMKKYGYVFDFAPDRTLKMVADAVSLSAKAGKTTDAQKQLLGEFLNYCPVISISGSKMNDYNVQGMLEQLKKASIDKTVKNGFEDSRLYNDELLKLTDVELKKFENLKSIVGASKSGKKVNEIDINNQGLTEEEREKANNASKRPKSERTPEEQAILDKIKAQKTQREKAISILRAISVRMPLLIYGAEVDFEKDVKISDLLDDKIIDPKSWDEFMPSKVTKELFKEFIKYYDEDIFVGASRKIRDIAKSAEYLPPEERVIKIADLFKCFKNPDKETVLTPWRVVNMHLGDCLGGYNFLNDDREDTDIKPKFIDNGKVTQETLANDKARILEINSKTGLYPLYVAFSIFKTKCKKYSENDLTEELQERLWKETIEKNIFVICKTPMAKQITKRTLVGYKDIMVNAHYFEDLINQMQNKPKQFKERILKPSYWNIKGEQGMEFDAIVGNPPYQIKDNGNGNSAKPIYNFFIEESKLINPNYISMICPSRWFAGGKGLDDFRNKMLKDRSMKKIIDYTNAKDCFPNISISGGINYFLWQRGYNGDCEYTSIHDGKKSSLNRRLSEFPIFIRYNDAISIINKIQDSKSKNIIDSLTSRNPFDIDTSERGEDDKRPTSVILYSSKGIGYVNVEKITANKSLINEWKIMISRLTSEHAGEADSQGKFRVLSTVQILKPNEICTDTYIIMKEINSQIKSTNALIYFKTKFARFLLLQALSSINLSKERFMFVPMQDFTEKSDIDWSKSIQDVDKQLYQKYNFSEEEVSYIESMIKPME